MGRPGAAITVRLPFRSVTALARRRRAARTWPIRSGREVAGLHAGEPAELADVRREYCVGGTGVGERRVRRPSTR